MFCIVVFVMCCVICTCCVRLGCLFGHYLCEVMWGVAHAEEIGNYCEHTYYDCAVDGAEHFEAWEPLATAEADGVKGAPYTVVEMQPECCKPYEVNEGVDVACNFH